MKKNNVFCFCYLIFIFLDSTRFLQNFEFVKLSYFLIVLSPKTVRMVTFEPGSYKELSLRYINVWYIFIQQRIQQNFVYIKLSYFLTVLSPHTFRMVNFDSGS